MHGRAVFARVSCALRKQCWNTGRTWAYRTRAQWAAVCFEIRAKGREGIGRAFYCTVVRQRIIILHAFIKKTEQTPQRELDIARARLKEVKA
jgi:phage-related protein